MEEGTMDQNPPSTGVETRPGGRNGEGAATAKSTAVPRANPAKQPMRPGARSLAERMGLQPAPLPPSAVTFTEQQQAEVIQPPEPILENPAIPPAEIPTPAPLDLSGQDGSQPPADTAAADGTETPVTLDPDSDNNDVADDEGQDFLGDDDDVQV